MNKLLRTTLLTLLLAAGNVVMAAETYYYVFNGKVFSSAGTQSLGGVSWTLATDAGYFGSDSSKGQQFGSGNSPAKEVTLSTKGIPGEVTEVIVNASTASGGSATLSVSVDGTSFGSQSLTTTATDYTFTGSAAGEIVIKLSQPTTSKALYVKSIKVTYNTNIEQRECGLEYSAVSCTATIGQTNTFPTLSNPNNLSGITYSSSNTVVASVNASGKVSLNSPGTTTITASYVGNDIYLEGSASYSLTVNGPALPTSSDGAFVKVTSADNLVAGDILIIVNETASKAMSTTQNTNNRGAASVTISNSTIANPGSTVQQVTLEGSAGAWNLKVGTSDYLYAGSSSNNQLKTGTLSSVGDKAKATITISGGNADIKFGGVDRNWLRYNSTSNLFNCYKEGQNPVQLYKMSSPTTVVTTAEELAAQEDDNQVRLVIADKANARLLYTVDGEAYVRDNTGAYCLSGVVPNVPFAPNQHIAGTIFGKKTSVHGMTVLVATEKTNTNLLAIAEPVTEPELEPVPVDNVEGLESHLADWVIIEAVRKGDVEMENRFNLTESEGLADAYLYDGVLADVSAIARPGVLCPINVNEVAPFTFVIDETKNFVSPSEDLANVRVRLVRTIGDYWNTLCLPFNPNIEGDVMEFTNVEGNKMLFSQIEGDMKAGQPYLVCPVQALVNPVFESVTLSAVAAQSVTNNGYSFVGIYSPYEMALDKSERFLGSDDNLHYPESDLNNANKLRGMRAFFLVPVDSDANIDFTDTNGIVQMETETIADGAWYTLSGIRVAKPQKGVYIHNGKKVVVK